MSDHIDVRHARDNLRHMKEEERQHAQEFWERTQAAGRAIQQTTEQSEKEAQVEKPRQPRP